MRVTRNMNEEEFAKSLLAHERKEWQNPGKIISRIGVSKGMSVADLACGPGFFVGPTAKTVGKIGKIYAVDKSPLMLDFLKSTIKMEKIDPTIVKILQADVQKTGIPSRSCDVVLFANILHDIEEKEKFFKEVKRISKPKSKIVDIDWKDVDNGFGPPLEIRLAEGKAKKCLEKNGFRFVKSFDSGPYHYGLIFGK